MAQKTSKSKTALSTLLETTYSVPVDFTEEWHQPFPNESTDPTRRKLQVGMKLQGRGSKVTFMGVVEDESPESLEIVYERFLTTMTNIIAAGRNPFQI